VPWKVLLKIIEPHYYPVAGRGCRPYALDSMLRVHLMQNWFALSDPAMEEALYEIASQLRAPEPQRANSGRDHHPEHPAHARGQRLGRRHLQGGRGAAGLQGTAAQARLHR
jgi:hypothetical protein